MKPVIVSTRCRRLVVLLLSCFIAGSANSQVWKYDFGTGTGTDTSSTASTTFLPAPPSGTARVRVGTGLLFGSIVLANPGLTALGSNSELQMTTNLGSISPTKFAVYDYTPGNTGYIKFKIAFGGGANGTYSLSLGDGATFSDNTSVNTNEVFASIRWNFGILNTISAQLLDNSTYVNTSISDPLTLFVQDTTAGIYQVEIYMNNSTTPQTYIRMGQQYILANDTWDLWVNNTRIGTALPSGALADNANIDSYVISHQANIALLPGTIFVDDIEYSNSLSKTTLSTSVSSLPGFGTVNAGSLSASSSFTVSGSNLLGNVLVTAPAHYTISADNVSFSDSITLSRVNGDLPSQPVIIYVRFAPAIIGTIQDSIIVSTSGMSSLKVAVSGTGASSFAGLSDIIPNAGFSYPQNILYVNYQASNLTAANSIEVGQFTIRDGGASLADVDTAGTTLTKIGFTVGNANQLRRIALYDGATELSEVPAASVISFTGVSIRANDGGTKTFSIRASFVTSVTDNVQISFTVNNSVTNGTGSLMQRTDAGTATSSTLGDFNKIEVVADRLLFDQQPTDITINTVMASAVTVLARDVNGNRDLDFSNSVSVTSSGTLTASPNAITAVSGVATFYSLIHMATGSGLMLTATSGSLTSANSSTFTITDPLGTILTFPSTWSGTPANAASVSQDANLNGTVTLTRGTGLTASSSSTRFNSTNWPTTSSLTLASNGAYLTFTLQAADGYALNLNSAVLNFTLATSAITGPTSFGVYSSVGGFTSTSSQLGATLSTSSTSVTFPSSGYTNLTSIEIRIYAWNAISSAGTAGIGSMNLVARNSPIQYTYNGSWSPVSPVGTIKVVNSMTVLSGSTTLSGDVSCSHVSISAGSVLTIGAGKKLTFNGVISGNGSIGGSNTSQVIINGSGGFGALRIDQTSASSRSLSSLVVNRTNGTISLEDSLNIYDSLSLLNGTLATAGKLKLIATATKTGVVPEIKGTGAVSGAITAEFFVSGTARRWRFLSSPFSNATFEDLRQEIYITGRGIGDTIGALNSNGFDATWSNLPSVYSYNETVAGNLNAGWEELTNSTSSLSNQLIVPGKGYRIFIRGDRSDTGRLNGTVAGQNQVILNLSGTINTGNISMPVTYSVNNGQANDGWNLLGNPYPCAYNWKAFMDDGTHAYHIDSTIYILDATSGSYKSYNSFSGGGTLTNGIIPMGASFWVKANGSSPSFVLTEQFKMTTRPAGLFKNGSADELNIRLELDSVTSDVFVLKHHPNSTANKDPYDIGKLNGEVNIMSLGNDRIPLTYDMRPMIHQNDTVNLYVSGGNNNYTLRVNDIPSTGSAYYYLFDQKLHSMTLLSPGLVYYYTTTASDASSFGYRFKLVISGSATLPVKYESFAAIKHENHVSLEWSTASEVNSDYFVVERSINGLDTWESIGKMDAFSKGNQIRHYILLDDHPSLVGKNYYRIKEVGVDHQFSYSAVQAVSFEKEEGKTQAEFLFPNPAKDWVAVQTGDAVIKVDVYDMNGLLLLSTDQLRFNIESIHPGIYFVEITIADGKTFRCKLAKN